MTREDVVLYIVEKAIRLIQYEHVDDLVKHERLEELKEVDISTNARVNDWLVFNEKLKLKDQEIPEGCCFAMAMWLRQSGLECCDRDVFEDEDEFVKRLVKEAGNIGKSIAYFKKKGYDIVIMSTKEFFSVKHAADFDGEVND